MTKRELVNTGDDERFVRRDSKGRFNELTAILKKEGDAPPPMALAPKQADAMKLLAAAGGADFKAGYNYIYAGHPHDKSVGKFTNETLPTLEMHLEHVKMLVAAH